MRWPVRWTVVRVARPAISRPLFPSLLWHLVSVPRCPPAAKPRHCSSVWAATTAQQASPIHALLFTMVSIKSCLYSFLNTYIYWSLSAVQKDWWLVEMHWLVEGGHHRWVWTKSTVLRVAPLKLSHIISIYISYLSSVLIWHFNRSMLNAEKYICH